MLSKVDLIDLVWLSSNSMSSMNSHKNTESTGEKHSLKEIWKIFLMPK